MRREEEGAGHRRERVQGLIVDELRALMRDDVSDPALTTCGSRPSCCLICASSSTEWPSERGILHRRRTGAMFRVIFEPDRGQRVPIRVWARAISPDTVRQLQRIASRPYVVEFVAAMADAHVAEGDREARSCVCEQLRPLRGKGERAAPPAQAPTALPLSSAASCIVPLSNESRYLGRGRRTRFSRPAAPPPAPEYRPPARRW
jgi:hypothetical protein